MKLIGITGPTGAGKTTALRALEVLGAHIIDADQVYHRLLEESEALKAALVGRFGPGILDQTGAVDRKALGSAVFGNGRDLEDLNAITHRFILSDIQRQRAAARAESCPAVAVDAISLIESGLGEECDTVVAVLAPLETRIQRIMAREGISEDYARRRAMAQKGDDFFRAHADHVLENGPGEDRGQFAARALVLFRSILAE